MALTLAPRPNPATWLWLLSALFLARVLGQMAVAFAGVTWLPPMPEWYSGLLPYPVLLPTQWLILSLMLHLNRQATRQQGWATVLRPRLGRGLLAFAALYAGGMVVRYVVSGELHPERRWWPPGSIPIVFHLVLARYLAVVASVCRQPLEAR
ncbi:MAG: hypothetical protein VKS61_14815 [Candidatus Sericytochromatia bacterium]|nr:hypothetical protein [Candidatus Sericytochromatia bacterium]